MARYVTRVVGTDEVYEDETERMGINSFCELLAYDSAQAESAYSPGMEVVLTDTKSDTVLARYVIGYK